MLTASALRKRSLLQFCTKHSALPARSYHTRRDGRRLTPAEELRSRKKEVKSVEIGKAESKRQEDVEDREQPSLFAQLFPDQDAEARRKQQEREIPRIPIHPVPRKKARRHLPTPDIVHPSAYESTLRRQTARWGPETSVLVLRNVSKNLVEEDFRRLIPSGQHMEGWTLEQGDILQVIPGRDLTTLEQQGYYYLLFSSSLGAFTYQGHTTRIHQLVQAHTPSSILSPMLPPPGYMTRGVDANAAIASFTLVAPNQTLEMRQLKPPLTPMVQAIIRNGGYPHIARRQGRMPFEVRLTLDGPQLHLSHIRHVLMLSGKDRGLSWSGEEGKATPVITKWEPVSQWHNPSPASYGAEAWEWADKQEQRERLGEDVRPSKDEEDLRPETDSEQQKRRTSQVVYVVGFSAEKAMRSFVAFWHRRPMECEGLKRGGDDGEGDLAPVTRVEVLW